MIETKSTHTPAPWSVEKRGHADDICAKGYGVVCEMPDEPDSEARANARLIAAAPDLLEACKGVLHHNSAVKAEYQLPQSLIRQIQSAIAKARA